MSEMIESGSFKGRGFSVPANQQDTASGAHMTDHPCGRPKRLDPFVLLGCSGKKQFIVVTPLKGVIQRILRRQLRQAGIQWYVGGEKFRGQITRISAIGTVAGTATESAVGTVAGIGAHIGLA